MTLPWSATGRIALYVKQFAMFAVIFSAWELAVREGWINPLLFGMPSRIAVFLWKGIFVSGTLLVDLGWTLLSAGIAFALGSIAGLAVGFVFIARPPIERVLAPLLAALNAMPRIALAPLFIIWFGLGIGSKIAVGFSLTFFIVLSSTIAGGRGSSADHMVLADTLGASQYQTFRTFVLPNAVPVIFSGLRLGLVYALLGVVGAELIAAEHGIGQTLQLLAASFETSGVFAILLLLAIVGTSITTAMTWLESRLLHWR